MRVDFSSEADAAFAAYRAAEQDLRSAQFNPGRLDEARCRLEATKATLAPFQESLLVSPVPASVYDDLIVGNPPTDEQRVLGYVWNPDTFAPALLAACVGQELPEGERMTEKDWTDWATTAGAGLSGDLARLFQACLQVNGQTLL